MLNMKYVIFFVRSYILIRPYSECSFGVKQVLFKAYCMCQYDAGIWNYCSVTVYNKFRSCYNKCIRMFFEYDRRFSVTDMLSELNLPCFACQPQASYQPGDLHLTQKEMKERMGIKLVVDK